MYTKWTSHLKTPDDKKRFENQVTGSKPVLERLITLIDEDLKAIEEAEQDFDNSSWAYKEAYLIGAKKELRKYRKLINLDEQVIKTNE